MKLKGRALKNHGLLTLLCLLVFLPFTGSVPLFDWDEVNFAECAREMVVTGDYSQVQINFQSFWEKPPLFVWMQALSMKIFGITEFAARFPNAICALLTFNLLFYLGRKLRDENFGLLWVLCYAGSMLPFMYFKSGIIDPWFNLFIFISLTFSRHWVVPGDKGSRPLSPIFTGVFAGLAVLTKGPAAILILGVTLLVSVIRFRSLKKINPFYFLLALLSFLIVGISWFASEYLSGNTQVIKNFIEYQVRLFRTQDSDHGGFLLYHFVVLLIGCLPFSIFMLRNIKPQFGDSVEMKFQKRWMWHFFLVVLILFSIVQTKIIHYSSLCYFPLSFLAAAAICSGISWSGSYLKILKGAGIILSFIVGVLLVAVSFIESYKAVLIASNWIADPFVMDCLKTQVKWQGYEWIAGVLFAIGSIGLFFARHLREIFIRTVILITGIFLTLVLMLPKVEQYSQGPAIDFYKAIKGKNVYVETLGFKSYAQLFYTERQKTFFSSRLQNYLAKSRAELNKSHPNEQYPVSTLICNWMLSDSTANPTIFVCKTNEVAENLVIHPNIKELYRKGGFSFLIKK